MTTAETEPPVDEPGLDEVEQHRMPLLDVRWMCPPSMVR